MTGLSCGTTTSLFQFQKQQQKKSNILMMMMVMCISLERLRKCKSQLDSPSLAANLQKNLLFLSTAHHQHPVSGLLWHLNVLHRPCSAQCWSHLQHRGKFVIITTITGISANWLAVVINIFIIILYNIL